MGWQEPEGNGLDARSYRAILGNPGIAAIILDADGLICEVSSCASAYLDRSPESLVGQHILEVTHPEDASATLESIRRLADGDESSRLAKRYVRADGSLLWADVMATPVRDSGGRLERVIAIVQNPTGGRLAEIALLDAQRNLVQLMNAISEGLLILDYRGHILAANASATALLGYDARTLKGLPLAELCVQPDGEGDVADLVHDMATGEVSTVTVQLRTADGARIPSELRVTHGTWSGESVLFVVWRDTTDRLRYEAELRASAEQLAAVFEASPGLLVLTDASTGEIINVNSAFERATGVSREGAIGHPAWELGLALAPQTQRPLMEMVRGHSSTPLESAYVTVDGEEREALVSAHSACIGGRPCILIAATDITEFRRAERALRQSEQQYRQVVEASGEAIAIRAREIPSTKTLTAPPGSFKSCFISTMVPTENISSGEGSSIWASSWLTKRISLSATMASSKAAIDFSRPTSRWITIKGNTNTPLRGNKGKERLRPFSLSTFTPPYDREYIPYPHFFSHPKGAAPTHRAK